MTEDIDDDEALVPLGKVLDDLDHARRLRPGLIRAALRAGKKPPPPLPPLVRKTQQTLDIEAEMGLRVLLDLPRCIDVRLMSTLADSGHALSTVTIPSLRTAVEVAADFGEDEPLARECLELATDNLRDMRALWKTMKAKATP